MVRAYIMLGFTFLLAHLHVSGQVTKYINMKYAYLSISAAVILGFLTIVHVVSLFKHEHSDSCDGHCGHHAKEGRWKRVISYGLFIFPIVSGLFFPVATLDASIVEAKGFHFPVSNSGSEDPFAQRQFLQPDTSIYYGDEGYRELMEGEKQSFMGENRIMLYDANFLKGMETIYNYPGDFTDKTLAFTGFVFHDESSGKEEYFLFRFGIIHCVADSGVYGMLVDKPDDAVWNNDDWIAVEGTIATQFYQPFRMNIPMLHVTKWTNVEAPKDPYVYRSGI